MQLSQGYFLAVLLHQREVRVLGELLHTTMTLLYLDDHLLLLLSQLLLTLNLNDRSHDRSHDIDHRSHDKSQDISHHTTSH